LANSFGILGPIPSGRPLSTHRSIAPRFTADDLDRLVVLFQPQVDLVTGRVWGMEALARMREDGGRLQLPPEFLDSFGHAATARLLSASVLAQTLAMCRLCLDHDMPLRVSLNVSGLEMADPMFHVQFLATVAASGVPPQMLGIELTEHDMIEDAEAAAENLFVLSESGVSIALDDLGVGYSSLQYLAMLPADCLKLDRVFVQGMIANARFSAVVASLLKLAEQLGMEVIAEGVETPTQEAALLAIGCRYVQGFRYCSAIRAETVPSFVRAFERADPQLILAHLA
jgi:EAL domain-containing protein (putative c-di-GMP-specific phosphodiesterase class I)